ncbi:hypothetical protein PC9H_010663 [Pleurotus ostreatus]|uniref:Uncharacterized protein n=2 Tax=Pleurotus TaxID=5320 RepID=A0A8H6ZK55_PLEOS|nr:uncharacterized protein PC9H_010663 [Pleurotus ostreatus]KAF7422507.1 hypothetical protein PC9H_010663 [Pleurotus ostreatus]KAG9227620.1 hypothetical protein CCMSSC00406_0000734 [Pleurotus cornucopiae]
MNDHLSSMSTEEYLNCLYQASPPCVSQNWRLRFTDLRESSPHDLFALLHHIDQHVEINVDTVIRTWDGNIPVYWVRFQSITEALVARGFAVNAEGRYSVKVTGALVNKDLFNIAETEESNPHAPPPLPVNRWDNPLRLYTLPPSTPTTQPPTPDQTSPTAPTTTTTNAAVSTTTEQKTETSKRSLYERLQRTPLSERITTP